MYAHVLHKHLEVVTYAVNENVSHTLSVRLNEYVICAGQHRSYIRCSDFTEPRAQVTRLITHNRSGDTGINKYLHRNTFIIH